MVTAGVQTGDSKQDPMKRRTSASGASLATQFADLLTPTLPANVRLRLWNGDDVGSSTVSTSQCIVTIESMQAGSAFLAARNDRQFAELYITRMMDIAGDIGAVFDWLAIYVRHARQPRFVWRSRRLLRRLPRSTNGVISERFRHTRGGNERKSAEITFHYDKPVEFWQLWLDPLLQYTCAYFRNPGDTLEEAQRNKLDLILSKLDVDADDHLLDIGCGWGGLLSHALSARGPRCTGVTLSRTQFEHATNVLAQPIAEGRCHLANKDLRTLGYGAVHKACAIGVLEHIGVRGAQAYFHSAHRQIVAGGRFLSQAICWTGRSPAKRISQFMDAYVFPGGTLLSISEAAHAAEAAGFEILDIETMRLHYVQTLRHWRRSLEGRRTAIADVVGDSTYRVFRLYLAASEHRFRVGKISVYQMLLRKPGLSAAGPPSACHW